MTELEDAWGKTSDRYKRLAKRLRDAERSVELIEAEVGHRPLRISLRRAYLPMMGTMSVMESPINRYAFELFFRNTAAISLGLAFMSGAILMFFAHSLGVSMRRFNHAATVLRRLASTFFIALILLLSSALIYGLGLLRQDFTSYVNRTAATGLGDLLRKGTLDLKAISEVATGSQLGHDALLLIGLNVALFLVGIIAAFVRHDPHPDYEYAIKRRSRADKRLSVYQASLDKKFDRARKRHADQLSRIGILVQKSEEELRIKETELEVLTLTIENDLKVINATLARRINAYRFGFLQEAKLPVPTEQGHAPTVTVMPKRS